MEDAIDFLRDGPAVLVGAESGLDCRVAHFEECALVDGVENWLGCIE